MTVRKIILLPLLCLVLVSCQKLLIKPDASSDPERNFEIFWNDVNNGYPYFAEDKINWKARYDVYRPTIKSSTSTEQLFNTMGNMLKGFSDGHLMVEYKGDYIQNEKTTPNYLQLVRKDQFGRQITLSDTQAFYHYYYNYLGICQTYIVPSTYREVMASDGINPSSSNTVCIYGLLKDENILYINITSFLTDYNFASLLQSIFQTYPNVQGLVLDLRMNGGGNLGTMWNALSVFLPSGVAEVKYAYTSEKVGPLPENFGPKYYFALTAKATNTRFLKPIVVLTNRGTISAAEHATMAMRQLKANNYNRKIKIVGDYTFGATSFIVQRTLPCGIGYTLVNSKTWDINQVVVERTGVKPDEQVYLTADMIQSNTDEQLLRAITVIKQDLF